MRSTPSDTATAALREISYNIDLAARFATGFDFDGFKDDLKTLYAVTRCLEIISEASRRLPDDLKARHPAIAWRNIAAAGNVYRHEYEDVAPEAVWDTLQLALPQLKIVMAHEISALGGSQ